MNEKYKKMSAEMTYQIVMRFWLPPHSKVYRNFAAKFCVSSNIQKVQKEFDIITKYYHKNLEEFEIKIARSPRTVIQYVFEQKKNRLTPRAEKIFINRSKNKYPCHYYEYCSDFNIFVEDYMRIVTEVAVGSAKDYEEEYLSKMNFKRKECKNFIEAFLKNTDLDTTDSIEKVLNSL